MNIARRLIVSYPENHPVIEKSVEKVLDALPGILLNRNDITIGVAKNVLIVGDSFLDRNNPINRDFANLLFSHGIAAISFSKQLTAQDLLAFFAFTALKREQVAAEGGIVLSLAARGVAGIQARPVDYSAFQATDEAYLDGESRARSEERSPFLWESFVRSLLADSLDQQGQLINLDPEVLAEFLNRRKEYGKDGSTNDARRYAGSLTAFIRQLQDEGRGAMREKLICRLGAFISRLSPELRNQFLNSAFSSLTDRPELAESILSNISEGAIIDALDELNARKESLPQMMVGIISKLSENLSGKMAACTTGKTSGAKNIAEERIKTLFREDNLDKFLPETYQKQLQTILKEGIKVLPEDEGEIEMLKKTLAPHLIEENISYILLDILNDPSKVCDIQVMEKNIIDLCGYFLGLGDFASLMNIHEHIRHQIGAGRKHLLEEVMAAFAKGDFVQEVLDGLRIWGKNKYQDIAQLIDCIGAPFVEPILERLAEEESMSLRRYYMDRLLAIGDIIKIPVTERLRDSRWYFVRNMILLLRNLGDSEAVTNIRRLTGHPHPKVRQEAIQALLHFGDSEVNRLLIRDLMSHDLETVINTVRLAEGCSHPDIFKKLVELLNRKGLSSIDCELKSSVIQTLGKIGNASALPELQRMFSTSSFFRSSHLNRLKEDAVNSLKFYPKEEVIPFLKSLCNSKQNEVRRQARVVLRQLEGGERDS